MLSDGTRLNFPRRVASHEGTAVVLGIRPQHITRASGQGGAEAGAVPVQVELVQVTGTRALVTFKLGGTSVVGDLDVGADCRPGETLLVSLDMRRAVAFDPQTEKALGSAG